MLHTATPRLEELEQRDTPSVNLLGIASSLTHSYEHYAQTVATAYDTYLWRPADQAALNAWVPWLQRGLWQQQFESAIFSSPEYYAKHGNNPAGWVNSVYWNVLHRGTSPGEQQMWVSALNGGMSTYWAAWYIDTSFEAGCVRTQTLYTNILHRYPGSPEQAMWSQWYQAGLDVNTAWAYMVASPEYRNQFTSNGAWLTEGYKDILGRYPVRNGNEMTAWLGSETGWEPMKWAVARPGESREASDTDLVQGSLGTCYLASSLGGSAQAGRDLTSTNRIQYIGHNEYWVRLYDPTTFSSNVRWIRYNGTVLTTDYQPKGDNGSDFWPLLYQRAYLDAYPGETGSGWEYKAMKVVNGHDNEFVGGTGLDTFTDDDFWKLYAATPATSTHKAVAALANLSYRGIVGGDPVGHIYEVVDVAYSGRSSDRSTWYVKLRNPWGYDMPGNQWSSTYTWALDHVNHDGLDNVFSDGFIRVSWAAFMTAFSRYTIN